MQANKKNITLNLVIGSEVPMWIQEDSVRLKQILINLINNALKFTNKGSITLRVEVKNDKLEFAVTDTGIGISAADQEKVFTKFFQAQVTGYSSIGVGLGLTISKQLVELLNGNIKLDSQLNHGTCVSFCIPFKAIPEPPKFQRTDVSAFFEMHPKSVLLAEDVEDNRLIISAFLAKTPWQVDIARDGREALDKLKSKEYDIVLMDIQMPIMNGYEAVEKYREWEQSHRTKHIPILALTAFALADDAQKSLLAGCDGHLTKPIKKNSLISAILAFTES